MFDYSVTKHLKLGSELNLENFFQQFTLKFEKKASVEENSTNLPILQNVPQKIEPLVSTQNFEVIRMPVITPPFFLEAETEEEPGTKVTLRRRNNMLEIIQDFRS